MIKQEAGGKSIESSELEAMGKTVSVVMGQANSINFRNKED